MKGRAIWSTCFFLLWLCLSSRNALAQVTPAADKNTFEIWMPALAALLGGLISGILGPILRDVVIQSWSERRSDRKLREQVEQSYFAPLSASAEKLIWRMSEVLVHKRRHFLLLKSRPTGFNQYKRLSTLYRIAALLGWIRAVNLELSSLPRGGFGADSPAFKAFVKVQSALADGHGVEIRRIQAFCAASKINLSSLDDEQVASLAAGFETSMYALVGDDLDEDHRALLDATELRQDFVCRGLLQYLAERKLTTSMNDSVLKSNINDLISCLGYHEILIYREWQDAIGDAMIIKDEYSTTRRYRIIGFEQFEQLIMEGNSNWIKPFKQFIENVDTDKDDPLDDRPAHLRNLAKAVAEVLEAIATSSQGALVNNRALQEARRIQKL